VLYADNDKCVASCKALKPAQEYPNSDSNCGILTPGNNSECWGGKGCTTDCYKTESLANNFIGLRSMKGSAFGDMLYAEVRSGVAGSIYASYMLSL
jgi:hypothetical protein